jgi:hypothetical protein
MDVIYHEIEEDRVRLFDPTGEEVAVIMNVLEFHDVRVQIKQHKLTGYYFVKYDDEDGERFYIDQNGRGNFETLFPKIGQLLDKMLQP